MSDVPDGGDDVVTDRLWVPVLADVDLVPPVLDEFISDELVDYNGHLNVRGYFELHMRATEDWFERLGMDEAYRERTRLTLFSLDHRIAYVDEILEGARVTVHVRPISTDGRITRGWSAIVNRSTGVVANVLHFAEGSVGLDSRRLEPMAEPLASAVQDSVRR